MPDRDACGFMYSMQGEHSMVADSLEREARDLERQAGGKRAEAAYHRQRAEWAGEAADALNPDPEPDDGDEDNPAPRAEEAGR